MERNGAAADGIRMEKRPEGGTCVIVTQKYGTEIPGENIEK